jgi:transposase-like protein
MLDSLLATLDPRSEQIVRLYYQHDLTQTEIGRQLGYSQMHVSRLLRQAITQLAQTAEPAKPEAMPRPDRTPAVGRAIEALPASIRYIADRQTALHG